MSTLQRPRRPKRVALMAELTGAASMASMVEAADAYLRASGVDTLVLSIGSDTGSDAHMMQALAAKKCDGLILHSDFMSEQQLAQWQQACPETVIAMVDNHKAGQLAAHHILTRGHRRIAMICAPSVRHSSQQQSDGFLKELHLATDSSVECKVVHAHEVSQNAGRDAMQCFVKMSCWRWAVRSRVLCGTPAHRWIST